MHDAPYLNWKLRNGSITTVYKKLSGVVTSSEQVGGSGGIN